MNSKAGGDIEMPLNTADTAQDAGSSGAIDAKDGKLSRYRDFARKGVLASFSLLLLVLVVSKSVGFIPLLLFVWGVWTSNWRSHIWLCFILLFYFLANINQLAHAMTPLLWLENIAIVSLFAAALLWCRWSKAVKI